VTELKLQLFQYASTNKHTVFSFEKKAFFRVTMKHLPNSVYFMACLRCTQTRCFLVNWHRVAVPQSIFVMIHAWQIELSKCFGHISRLHTNIFRNN